MEKGRAVLIFYYYAIFYSYQNLYIFYRHFILR